MVTTQPQTNLANGFFDWLRTFSVLEKVRWGSLSSSAPLAVLDGPVTTMPPERPRVAPRLDAEAELKSLLDEIPAWPDSMLIHMHKRFTTSRLFRVHHEPGGPLTGRAEILRDATRSEMDRRGLSQIP